MKLLFVLAAAFLAGCTTPSRMDVQDLNHYKIDCSRREEQLAFLQGFFPTPNERIVNGLRITSPLGIVDTTADGTYYEERAMYDRRQESAARVIIHQIHSYCPAPQPQPQGCVHINETFPTGSSQGARCYQKSNPKPVVNRWEVVSPK
jgi:hypothetical protein